MMCFNSSTDSELKLWNVESGQCLKTYKGHTNEKNFVGLTVNKSFIACGKWRDKISRDRYTMDWSHSEYCGSPPQKLDSKQSRTHQASEGGKRACNIHRWQIAKCY